MARYHNEPIAIVGSGCRFPGDCTSPSKLWQLLQQPRDVLSRIPAERFNPDGFYHVDGMHHGSTNVKDAYFLSEDHRLFDADFFKINPLEASAMDPQQRLLLEVVYESLESAGLPVEKLRGSKTAVYVGLMGEEYSDHLQRNLDALPVYMGTGTARSIMSNRISYFFDWCGPSMTIDTACSSSLVSVHQAVQALRAGDSRMAVAAGSNLMLSPEPFIAESKLKMLSPTGRSRMWDSAADGYARADGVAAVILKTLSTALEDGDQIECIIRETGINHDGRSRGITVPSSTAQESLIRDTYRRAGLDLSNKQDRCQYFEAHGTGTPAGDPPEAEAISRTFFTNSGKSIIHDSEDTIYVGSVKTVIGHTEGTAGLAGVLKASLALQHAVIPPNMLFERLNPDIEPFYSNLEILSQPKPWPSLTPKQPRRASVNSFGFGGSNAHVILESFEPTFSYNGSESKLTVSPNFVPLTFSAASERSLTAMVTEYSSYLKSHTSTDLRSLSHTLYYRRSSLPFKVALSGPNVETLVSKMDASTSETKEKASSSIGTRSSAKIPRVLGVFTGQGAQWASMGRSLILGSKLVRKSIESLDHTLAQLPVGDRPSWSILEELLADADTSRLSEAIIAQPLCTAVQVVLVDLLHPAGLRFEAVVGHSSGEIAAAYAAGFISSQDAIKIAYYRGLHTRLAGSAKGKPGAMLAVGTSLEDAKELCELEDFEGRICVAASNSPSSVTLSGDLDAINEAKAIFDEEKKFARVLAVDKAYHSHHMLPCSEPYAESLRACDISTITPPGSACSWFSSVDNGNIVGSGHRLGDCYWRDNMANPVLYAQAIECAMAAKGSFDLVLEVGPHPALKGPTLQTIQELSGETVPYSGLLSRGKNDVESFADALGFVWTHYGGKAVDFEAYNRAMSGTGTPKLIKDLPTYPWDHDRIFWLESRPAKAFRTRKEPVHELLGTSCGDGSGDLRWKNLLRPVEMPWLDGHQLQGETVFPAAGYVATALESAKYLAEDRPIELIELQDLVIGRPITFDDNESGVEILFTLNRLQKKGDDDRLVTADFKYHSAIGASEKMTLVASGSIQIRIGEPVEATLPPRAPPAANMIDVDSGLFYSSLSALGYGYTGPFRALSGMKRRLDMGTGLVTNTPSTGPGSLLVHPAMLDAAFQSAFLAFCWPEDGSLQELQVPTRIHRIRVNPLLCQTDLTREVFLPFDSVITDRSFSAIEADVDVFAEGGQQTILQVEGIRIVPFAEGIPSGDRQLFSEVIWDVALPDAEIIAKDNWPSPTDFDLATVADQASFFYLLRLKEEITESELARSEWHHKKLFEFADHTIAGVLNGQQVFSEKEWVNTTRDEVYDMMDRFPESLELKLIRTVGENLPAAVRGQTNILQHMMQDNLLNRFYEQALGVIENTSFMARVVGQISHRYPQMNILEIGAGTGGATKSILRQLDKSYSTYTFTDISTGFFETAQEVFKDRSSKMIFKALDLEKDISSQGFTENSYDLVIGSLVFHATKNLRQTMTNVRKLLKPGGFLVMLELLGDGPIRMAFSMSGLPGWWLGGEDGRSLSPCIGPLQWHSLLRETGFSGADTITPMTDVLPRPLFVIASQALDDRIDLLRRPLMTSVALPTEELVILGGTTVQAVQLADSIGELMKPRFIQVVRIDTLENLALHALRSTSAVISITELDDNVFKNMTSEKFSGLKRLFDQTKLILWVTQGCRELDPYSNVTVGLGRTLAWEMPQVRIQFLDVDPSEKPNATLIAETFLRLHTLDSQHKKEPSEPFLWSIEPEIAQENGRLLIPRLRPKTASNNRYNSSRRAITKNVDLQQSTVNISYTTTSLVLEEATNPTPQDQEKINGRVFIRVSHSVLSPIRVSPNSMLFLLFGSNVHTGEKVVALSDKQASMVDVPKDWVSKHEIPASHVDSSLFLVAAELLAQYLVSLRADSRTMMVHEPDPALAAALTQLAAVKNVSILFSSTSLDHVGSHWLSVHPFASERAIKSRIPEDVSVFVDTSMGPVEDSVSKRILAYLPHDCNCIKASEIWGQTSTASKDSTFRDSLIQACERSNNRLQNLDSPLSMESVALRDVRDVSPVQRRSTVVDWAPTATIPVAIEPVDSKLMFSSDKTYILFGLTSDLGQSLCQWIVRHGARFVVLTSRAPKVQESWMKDLQVMGATIKVYANDVTDQKALQILYSDICATMPAVAGVVNGAMVLQDTLFSDMDLETLQKVMRPKVNGSKYLDELFSDVTLDFFIFFSSVAALYGNRGQSNYSAASMFMTGLAYQRRKRGLAASVIYIGPIMGAGYVTRTATQGVRNSFQAAGFQWLSEREFHQAFAEAILTGRPEAGLSPELVFGPRDNKIEEGVKTQWYENPKFQHMVNQEAKTGSQKEVGNATLSARAKLMEAVTREEVYEILKSCFISKLQIVLQLHVDATKQEAIVHQGANELGIDSLIAVEIRTWFLKEVEVDMPLMKILGGALVGDLLEFAVEKLPQELLPKFICNKDVEEPQRLSPSHLGKDPSDTQSTESPEDSGSSEGEQPARSAATSISASEEDLEIPSPERVLARTEDMSFGQSRFWSLMSLLEDRTTFNIVCLANLKGYLRLDELDEAVAIVGQRYEALRTCFFADELQQPRQGILQKSQVRLESREGVSQAEVTQEFEDMKSYSFDLEQGETVRVILLSQSPTSHFMIVGYHHIVMDGVSLEVFLSDVQKVYNRQGLPSKMFHYPDFATRQRRDLGQGPKDNEMSFWKKEFPSIPAPLPLLPFSETRYRRTMTRYDFNSVSFKIIPSLTLQIKESCRKCKVTPFHFFLAAFKTLLFRLLDTDDVCIGIADANRLDKDVLESIGNYLNLLPLRFRSQPSQNFNEALKEARTKAYAALAHSRVPFDVLIEQLDVPRSATHNPLFQAFVNYRQGVAEKRFFGECEAVIEQFQVARTGYDVSLDILDNPGGDSTIMFMVQKDLYSDEDAHTLMKYYVRLLETFAKDSEMGTNEPSIFDKKEIQHAVDLGQGPIVESEWPATLSHRVNDISREFGDNIALKDGLGNVLTYSQMAERTALIAARILAEKVEPGRVVAVFQEPTCDWICSLLAILRIGAIYVPLDLRTTLPRLATIVNDCQPLAIVVHTATSKDVPALVSQGAKIIDISTLPCPVPESLPAFARADDPAVILYTSGSTGAPKGIILKHSSLVNEIEECTEKFGLGQEIVLQQSALSFDFSLFQIFAAIANGGTLYVVPRSGRGDPIALTKIIAAEKVTLTGAVPSEYASWLRHGVVAPRVESSWKIAVAGGEVVENDFVREFYSRSSPEMRLFQVYGPTEITISSHKIELASMQDQTRPEDFQIQIPVGYTSRNCSTYIVDEKLQPVPLGHQGEILIGGAGVAQGYLNNRQLTKQAFVPNAYAPPIFSSKGWKNVHRTGDRGRLRADGALLFEGRIAGDTQIKLRGIRIDFRDIESTIIREAKGVLSDAVVSLRTDPETLVAHVVFSPDHPWNNEGEVAKFLKQILSNLPLPQYMIPAMMIPLDTLPLNAHSKTDRLAIRALPLPLRAKPTESARLTEAESILRGIWIVFLSKDITNHHSIDPQADFFHVGGNSALLVRLQVRIRQTFSIALPLMDLFESSTLGGMASRIENSVAAVAIDWEHETELSESLLRVKTDIPNFGATSKDTSSSKVVLITGSTGYLGKHLLGKFIDNPTVSKIHCIAIRHPDLKHPVDSSKIINHQGDLTQPLLGLSNVAFQALVAEVDLVIHAGAQRSFWDSYHLLRVANLSSTQELVKLSAPRRIPIHFISSGGVLHLTVGDDAFSINNGENSVAAFPPPTDGSKGYVASKWASEVYLEKAARALDIPVSIHRSVPAAAGSSSTTPAHILADFVRFSKQMKALPSSHGWTGDFDLMPVNELAARVCTVALSAPASSSSSSPKTSTSRDEGQVTFVHHGAEVKLVAKEVAEQLEKAVDGGGVEGVQGAERIPAVEWVGRAKKMGFGWFFAAQNMVLDEEGEDGDGDGRGGRLVSRR